MQGRQGYLMERVFNGVSIAEGTLIYMLQGELLEGTSKFGWEGEQRL